MTGAALLALMACGQPDGVEDEILEAREEVAEAGGTPGADRTEVTIPAEEAAGSAFLIETRARPGVTETESGLLVETLEEGEPGGESPGPTDIVRIDYEARFPDGRLFDSSEANGAPVVLPSYEVLQLPGLIEALPAMREGQRARLVLPPDLAFAGLATGGQQVPEEMAGPMVFDVTLVEVIDPEDEARVESLREEETARMQAQAAQMEAERAVMAEGNEERSAAFLEEVRAREGVRVTGSGLAYRVVGEGEGTESPDATDRVTVHYRGTLPDGTEFDSSYGRGAPATFALDQVIPGWTEGVQLMEVGDTYEFYVPAELAYGEAGTPGGPIGPRQALVFEVELLGVEEAAAQPDAPDEPTD